MGDTTPVVGIGASAGGLEAFTQLLGGLPVDTGMAYLLVQHLDPTHASALAELLARSSPIPVLQASDGMRIDANQAYVIPLNTAMTLADGHVRLVPRDDVFKIIADDVIPAIISDSAIVTARSGCYSAERLERTVSPERQRRFFVGDKDGYHVSSILRDLCVFARQDVTSVVGEGSTFTLTLSKSTIVAAGSDAS